MKDRKQEIREKIDILNRAAKAYYQDGIEIMPNIEYDRLYDELRELERETGIVFANSPTRNVGYEVLSELPRERHPSRMLSLDKTKSRQELVEWLGDQQGLLSWKLDGLTIVLTYENGELVKALTRGNGEIGEVITGNARVFANVPVNVPYRGRLVLRGEAIITYSEFRRINSQIGDADAKYKNPRNLCSGSVRQLDPAVTRSRNVRFIAFSLVEAENVDFGGTRSGQLEWLASQGFDVVEYRHVDKTNLPETIDRFEEQVKTNDFPSDGLVLIYDDIEYGRSLGTTAKFPRDSIAFKWEDQQEETVLRKIEWSASRTGLSIMRELKLGIGDRIRVYKANMIIPQISENLTGSDTIEVPEVCPVCSGKTEIRSDSGVSTLYCTNPLCPAKQLKSFSHFVSRNAMNIEGLSEATLEKLISRGLVREFSDLFRLDRYRAEITEMEGFGEKSFENLTTSAERARRTTPERLLYALGIPGIGAANARLIVRAAHRNWKRIQSMTIEELTAIDGVGEIMAQSYVSFFQNPEKKKILEDLLEVLILDETEETRGEVFQGMTFVITGSLEHYENRDALKAEIEKAGGKVAGSVSGKTSWLINNNVNSTSGKNRKAHELGVPIINEETVRKWIAEGEITNG